MVDSRKEVPGIATLDGSSLEASLRRREVALPEINEEREVPWASLEWKHMKKERSV